MNLYQKLPKINPSWTDKITNIKYNSTSFWLSWKWLSSQNVHPIIGQQLKKWVNPSAEENLSGGKQLFVETTKRFAEGKLVG